MAAMADHKNYAVLDGGFRLWLDKNFIMHSKYYQGLGGTGGGICPLENSHHSYAQCICAHIEISLVLTAKLS